MLQIMCAWPSFCLCVTQFCAHIFVYIFLNSMVLCVLSPQLQKCSQSCAYVQQASWKNLLKTSLHKYYLRLHNCIPNCSIMIYIQILLCAMTYIQACSWGYQGEITPTWGVASTFKAYVEKGGREAAVNLTWTWTQKRQLQQALLDQQSSVKFTHVIVITCWVVSQHLWLWGGPEDTEITIIKLL